MDLNVLGSSVAYVKNSNLSLYIGRVVYVPDNYEETGILYVDLDNIRSQTFPSDAKEADAKFTKTRTGITMMSAYRAWHNPPKLDYRGSLVGNGSISINSYMFDPQMLAWMTLVSATLKTLTAGIAPTVETQPWQVSISEISGISVPQVDLNPSEIVNDALNEFMDDLFVIDLETSLFKELEYDEAIDSMCNVLGKNLGTSYNNIVSSILMCLLGEDGLIVGLRSVYSMFGSKDEKTPVYGLFDGLQNTLYQKYVMQDFSNGLTTQLQKSLRPILSNLVIPIVDLLNSCINKIKEPVYSLFSQINNKLNVVIPKIKSAVEAALNSLPLDSLPNIVKFLLEKLIKPLIKKLLVKLMGKAKDLIQGCLGKVVEHLIQTILISVGISGSEGSLTKIIFEYLIHFADFSSSAIGKCLELATNGITKGFGKVMSGMQYLADLKEKLDTAFGGSIDTIQGALNAIVDSALNKLMEYRTKVLEAIVGIPVEFKQFVLDKANQTFGNAFMLVSKLCDLRDLILGSVSEIKSLTEDSMKVGDSYDSFVGNALVSKIESYFDKLEGDYSMDILTWKELNRDLVSSAKTSVKVLKNKSVDTQNCIIATYKDITSLKNVGAFGESAKQTIIDSCLNTCETLASELQNSINGFIKDCLGVATNYVLNQVTSLVAGKVKEAITDSMNPIQKLMFSVAMKSIDSRLDALESYADGFSKGQEVANVLSVVIDQYISNILSSLDFSSFMESAQDKIKVIGDLAQTVGNASSDLMEAANALSDIADKIDSLTGGLSSGIMSGASLLGVPSVSYSINTGNDYSAHWQSKPKSQLPWCQGIFSEDLIKNGSLVLMASIGNSMDNLYIIDLLPTA